MKYKALLKFLRALMYIKRLFWWLGGRIYFVLAKIAGYIFRPVVYVRYKILLFLKRVGITRTNDLFFKRDFLLLALFVFLVLVGFGQTTLTPSKNLANAAQKSIAYNFIGSNDEVGISTEDVFADAANTQPADMPVWRSGAVINENESIDDGGTVPVTMEPPSVVAGGAALSKPIIIPGATIGTARDQEVAYTVEPGDSLGSIANDYDVSVPTIMWENNLTLKSVIKPGDVLKIPPATGIMHTVKKGDTIKKIAALYNAQPDDIVSFNHLKPDGTDLVAGERILVPDGVKPKDVAIVQAPKTTQMFTKVAAPPPSLEEASASGFVWPTGAHIITQYFGPKHHAIDIAGPWQTPNYAAKAGVVQVAQCGWNSGYGCYIIIDHGNGLKTLYGHNSVLLVSPGDYVQAGQTIGLMGNTGNVRGITGIHLHFEVIVNNARVNPLGYVR